MPAPEPALGTETAGCDSLGQLFPFQREGVARLIDDPCLLLADEMGLGKTIQAIAAFRILKARGALGQALVVAPFGLVLQWRRQLRHWAPELRLSTVVGAADDRRRAWAASADVFLASYETIRGDIAMQSTASPGRRVWDVVAADEAQRLENPKSATAHALKRLQRHRTWALTGTPLENQLEDLLSILDFVAPGRFDPNRMAVGLRQLLSEVQLRRRRRDVLHDLPPKLSSLVPVALGPRQAAAYRRARDEGLVRLNALGRDVRITHVLELILRLKQICNFCPETGSSAKLDDMRERLKAALASDEKALIFSQFVGDDFGAGRLASELGAFSPLVYSGEMDQALRAERIAQFERDRACRLLILSLRAGGVGLNLTSASHVFHFDRWWNPAIEAQAEDRAHRMGQTRPVHVHAYLCVDTIEERIDEILSEKRALFADVVDGVDTNALRRFDLETLLALVRAA